MNSGSTPNSRIRREIRTCKHPGCGLKFEGSPTSLYCMGHRTRKSRAERFIPKKEPRPEENNLVLESAELGPVQKTFICSLPQCGRAYAFTLYPDHNIYPMYCELHRTEHKRSHFLRMTSHGRPIRYEEPAYRKWSDYEMDFESYSLKQPHLQPFAPRRGRAKAAVEAAEAE